MDPPEYILLLNADTIVKEHALSALVKFMDGQPKAGIAGSMLLSPDGVIQASPFRFPGIASELDRGLRLGIVSRLLAPWNPMLKLNEACSVGWVSGASMILRRTMLEQVGLLDEGLYTYFDDVDICLRARRAGWETWYVPESKVVHLEGASTGIGYRKVERRLPTYWYQARHRFFTKNYGALYTALADAAFISGYAVWCLRRRLQRKPDTDPPHMLIDSIRHSIFCAGPKVRAVENPALGEVGARQ
jgi:GT2 family glycosyltransferase